MLVNVLSFEGIYFFVVLYTLQQNICFGPNAGSNYRCPFDSYVQSMEEKVSLFQNQSLGAPRHWKPVPWIVVDCTCIVFKLKKPDCKDQCNKWQDNFGLLRKKQRKANGKSSFFHYLCGILLQSALHGALLALCAIVVDRIIILAGRPEEKTLN